MNEEEICIHFKLNIKELDNYDTHSNPYEKEIHAHLVKDGGRLNQLKIFFSEDTNLNRKISNWISEQDDINELFKRIDVVKINNKDRLIEVDFSDTNFVGLTSSDNSFEGNLKFFLIKFDGIRLVFQSLHETPDKDGFYKTEIYLNKPGRKLIESQYSYLSFYDDGEWKAKNRHSEFIDFGEVKYRLNFNFYTNSSKSESPNINKEPRIEIKHPDLEEKKLLKIIRLISSLLSLYRHRDISFITTRIHKSNSTTVISKNEQEILISDSLGFSFADIRLDHIQLLGLIEWKLLDKADFISKIIHIYNRNWFLSGETRFMILFNCLEQIKTEAVGKAETKQKFKFNIGWQKARTFIKKKLRELSEIIDESQRVKFEEHVITQEKSLMFLPMKKQLSKIFDLYSIDLESHNIVFSDVIKIRNEIFHGNVVSIGTNDLKKLNHKLQIIVLLLILSFIEVLPKIKGE